jgi:hypothetical protein
MRIKIETTLLLGFFALAFVLVGLVYAGRSCGMERHPRFRKRLLVLSALLPLPVLLVLVATYFHVISQSMCRQLGTFVPFLGFVLILVPGMLFRPPTIPPPESDDDDWRHRPDEPKPDSPSPTGGIPLPDSAQSRLRVRDHAGAKTDRTRVRRPARETERRPLAPTRR